MYGGGVQVMRASVVEVNNDHRKTSMSRPCDYQSNPQGD